MNATLAFRAEQIEQGYRQCQRLTRDAARNFYYAFIPLPSAKRRSIYAIYSFCRQCDDIADEPGSLQDKQQALEWQGAMIDSLYDGGNPFNYAGTTDDHTIGMQAALADTIHRYAIPRQYFHEFLAGVRTDLTDTRYRSFAELRTYCYRVASVVGLMTLEIFGYDPQYKEEARAAAVDLGLAMQLTNILRDVKEDAQRGRIYLPEIEWREFALSEQQLLDGTVDSRFRAFMSFQVSRARHHFSLGAKLLPLIPRTTRVCPATLQALYMRILERIEDRGYDVYEHRCELSTQEKVSVALLTWARTWLSVPGGRRP